MNKKLLIIPALTVATIIGAVSVRTVSAESSTKFGPDSLIQKLVTKFNLNESEVRSVFESEKAERQTAMEQRFTETLDQSVKDGKLTEAQKKLILDKRAELEAKREADMSTRKDPGSMTDEQQQQHKADRKAEMESLKSWADQNGINLKYLMGHMRGMGHMGKHMFMAQP